MVFHRNCLFRDCLSNFLSSLADYEAVSIDHGTTDKVDQFLRDPNDLILLDLNLPDSLAVEIVRAVKERQDNTKVIVLVPDEHDQLVECIAAGVHGCVLERSPLNDLQAAIQDVLAGQTYCSTDIVATMFAELARFASKTAEQPVESKGCRLTVREQEVLDLLSKRKSNKQIASELSVSLFTVKNHVHNLLEKLNVDNRVEAVEMARQQNRLSARSVSKTT
ncbi:Transcriptional regulatory protein DegU [Novipirellula artificiosorum]|uniref:Transcriptional regulatory protein DegU n=1 Tax=Novipirellula artificiosorum TaxID=2528016 RepID=A0A5C6DTX7_9BACT|nr:Transcriptional regulatory protein DegU [Novipirellula artificiosorum]